MRQRGPKRRTVALGDYKEQVNTSNTKTKERKGSIPVCSPPLGGPSEWLVLDVPKHITVTKFHFFWGEMREVILTDDPAQGVNVVVFVSQGEETFHELIVILHSPCRR